MFQLKNFVSIAASMLNYVRSTTGKVTDLQPGSVTRTILEAPATEIEELYVQMFNGIKEAIPVAVYNSIDFPRLPPQYAAGRVTVVALQPLTNPLAIPKGTRFLSRDGRAYLSVADMTWPASATNFVIPVTSALPGAAQNAAEGEINSSPTFPPDRFSFSNTAITNGADTEADDSRDRRFADYISSLSRGTRGAMLYGAKTAAIKDEAGNILEAVSRASMVESSGSVKIYIWGTNGAPSSALLNLVTNIELGARDALGVVTPGYVAAGIRCDVAPMTGRNIDLKLSVSLSEGISLTDTLKAAIKSAIDTRLTTIQPGQTITAEEIRIAALVIPGVMTAEIANINNIVCDDDEVLMAGAVTIEQITPANAGTVTTS